MVNDDRAVHFAKECQSRNLTEAGRETDDNDEQ
jgi:hypothetical protein